MAAVAGDRLRTTVSLELLSGAVFEGQIKPLDGVPFKVMYQLDPAPTCGLLPLEVVKQRRSMGLSCGSDVGCIYGRCTIYDLGVSEKVVFSVDRWMPSGSGILSSNPWRDVSWVSQCCSFQWTAVRLRVGMNIGNLATHHSFVSRELCPPRFGDTIYQLISCFLQRVPRPSACGNCRGRSSSLHETMPRLSFRSLACLVLSLQTNDL